MKKHFILFFLIGALLVSCGKDKDKDNNNDNTGGGSGEVEILVPTVSTLEVVDITSTSAKVTAVVENDGGAEVTKRGVEYACASFSEPDHDCYMGVIYAGFGAGEYQCEITDLYPNETIYVRAFAVNEAGESYGEEIMFTTLNDEGNDEDENIINGFEYVDLGLPSGLKWATTNVGAASPYEVGEYFSWGELKSKDRYGMDNCPTYGVPMEDFSGDAGHDVAAFAWGSTWKMPTETEVRELKDNCTWEWIMQDNGVWGSVATGPNGNQVFFPSGGFMTESNVDFADAEAAYWTSSPDNNEHDAGYATFFYVYNNNFCNVGWMSRYVGLLVRPVSE